MIEQIYTYAVYLYGEDEPIELSQTDGEKLKILLMSQKIPKVIFLNNENEDCFAVSAIRRIRKELLLGSGSGGYNGTIGSYITKGQPIQRELTTEEKEVRARYLKVSNNKLLN